MSYPPPPGINNLPARPPASSSGAPRSGGFKPAFNAPTTTSYTPPTSYGPTAPPSQYGAPSPYSARPSPVGGMSSSYSYNQQVQPQSYGHSATPASYQSPATTYGAPPQIRNPFPLPGQPGSATGPGGDFDPEMAAQIAQWQSAYVTKDEASGDQQPSRGADVSAAAAAAAANVHAGLPGEKKKTVAREGGGKKWTDDSLLEWDPSHLRLFVGNLAGETTDDSLLKAFSRWKSVQKAKVIRDKRTTKSKGFGFVSFSDADDFFQAAKEMNGKYIQSHPVVVRKANTEIKVTNVKEKDRGGKNKKRNHGNNNQGGSGAGRAGSASGYDPSLGPVHGAGVTKPGQKTKNGLRLLG
ncbi:hypothetical protein NLU13_1953 [Sarocladium strictum]|uniref:RRM domain-containing protein n=1 Tax=Sarocladium strictum TaxID=5046 RepID=A0AA39GTH1_SARSR|nr:hypothetical protein NLU13_1953 [Sarocladium strictum]